MKSVENLLPLDPTAKPSQSTDVAAGKEAQPQAGRFGELLAEATNQHAASQGTSEAPPAQAAAPASVPPAGNERGIELPPQSRSIHSSIGRNVKGVASVPQSNATADAAQPSAAQVQGQGQPSGKAVALDALANAPASANDDPTRDPAAMAAVLGQVATVVARIVVPPHELQQLQQQQAQAANVSNQAGGAGGANGGPPTGRMAALPQESLNPHGADVVPSPQQSAGFATAMRGAIAAPLANGATVASATAANVAPKGNVQVPPDGPAQQVNVLNRVPGHGADAPASDANAATVSSNAKLVVPQAPQANAGKLSATQVQADNSTPQAAAAKDVNAQLTRSPNAQLAPQNTPPVPQNGAQPNAAQLASTHGEAPPANRQNPQSARDAQVANAQPVNARAPGLPQKAQIPAANVAANPPPAAAQTAAVSAAPAQTASVEPAPGQSVQSATNPQSARKSDDRSVRDERGSRSAHSNGGDATTLADATAANPGSYSASVQSDASVVPAAQPANSNVVAPPAPARAPAAAPTQMGLDLANAGFTPVSPTPLAVKPSALVGTREALEARAPGQSEAKSGRPLEDRIQGFTRGALGGSLSAYVGRSAAHPGSSKSDSQQSSSGKQAQGLDERDDEDTQIAAAPDFLLPQVVLPDPTLIPQAPPPQSAPQQTNAPMPQQAPQGATPAAPIVQVEFAARPQGAQNEAASISIHHPDLGPIQLEVQRDQGKVEVHAVIASQTAAAVLRANESGIRQGVQQSGMQFSALRVRMRDDDQPATRTTQPRRRRTNERE